MALARQDVVERIPLDSAGVTGARLEQVTLADGRVLVEKTVDQRSDWLMRATGDDGRIFRLWTAGVFQGLPDAIDSTVESVEERPDGWLVVMRDVSDSLVPDGQRISPEQSQQVLGAVARLHEQFAGRRIDGLCPVVRRLDFLTPKAVRRVDRHPLRDVVLNGWDRFLALAPQDIGRAVLAIADRPDQLAAALEAYPETLLHGDLKMANIGFAGDTVVLLDWGTLSGMGPPALDYAWYVAVNSAAIDASLDDLVAQVEGVLAPDDRDALPLALLGQVVLLGFEKALRATSDDPDERTQERAGLDWWCRRAAEALESWSPL